MEEPDLGIPDPELDEGWEYDIASQQEDGQ